jgi:hypothetical protein
MYIIAPAYFPFKQATMPSRREMRPRLPDAQSSSKHVGCARKASQKLGGFLQSCYGRKGSGDAQPTLRTVRSSEPFAREWRG